MSTALALIDDNQYNLMAKLASVAAKSGYVGKNDVQALFVILKGHELGISPMQALDGIQIISNKTTVSPQLMLALINRSGLLEDMTIDPTEARCVVMMKRVGRSPHTETFTSENAIAMGLWGKDNWKKQPAVMLKWRAVSACARIVFPDVIQGMYTPEEMGAEVSEDASGEIVISTPATVIPADFKTSEDAVAALVEKNPVKVDDDGVIQDAEIIDATSPNSSAAPQTDERPATPKNGAETAKSRFAGHGAPANGEKKTIAKKTELPGWRDSADEVYKAVRPLYNSADHMRNSVEKLAREGKITDKMLPGEVIPIIQNHKDDEIPPF